MVKNLIIKCKGLPYSCTEAELTKFLGGSGIEKMDLPIRDGKALGDATVIFNDEGAYKTALKKDREHMGHRYIEVFPADEDRRGRGGPGGERGGRPGGDRGRGDRGMSRDRYDSFGYGGSGRGGPPPPMGGGGNEGIIRLRGLPFGARERDVCDFFAPLPILQGGVLLPDDRNGPKARGEAYVVFEDPQSAVLALQRHMKNMQHRYIEVFEANYQDMVDFCDEYRLRVPRLPAEMPPRGGYAPPIGPRMGADYGPMGGDYGPPRGGGGYDNFGGGAGPTGYGPPGPDYGYTRSPGVGGPPAGYPERRAGYDAEPNPYAGFPSTQPAARGPDPYGRAAPPADTYGRAAPPAADPYGRPAAPAVDDYGRGGGSDYAAADPYGRGAAPAADPYGRPPAQTSWRDEREEGRGAAPAPAAQGGGGYSTDAWEGYGYGSNYRQLPAGGPMRRESAPRGSASGPMGGGDWREEGAPRGRERPGQKYVLKMRGVPFRSVESDVFDFFDPIRPAHVEIVREPGGRPSGEARVEFDTRKDYDDALLKDKQYMGSRYVELFPDFGGRY